MSAARLWLIRHGQSTWNVTNQFQGQADPPLSELGQRQAKLVAARLADLGPVSLYSSDLRRCSQTAEPIAAALGVEPRLRPGLREIDLGRWSGLTREEIQLAYPDEWERWLAGEDFTRGGGESYAQLLERVVPVMDELLAAHPGEQVVAVTHGGCIRCFVAHAIGLDPESWTLGGLDNASITTLRTHRGGLHLERFNDVGHLDGPAV